MILSNHPKRKQKGGGAYRQRTLYPAHCPDSAAAAAGSCPGGVYDRKGIRCAGKLCKIRITHKTTVFNKLLQEDEKMCKDFMLKYIRDALEDLSENTVADLYWFLKMELGM